MIEDYLKNEFRHLGWNLGHSMDDAANPTPPPADNLFLY